MVVSPAAPASPLGAARAAGRRRQTARHAQKPPGSPARKVHPDQRGTARQHCQAAVHPVSAISAARYASGQLAPQDRGRSARRPPTPQRIGADDMARLRPGGSQIRPPAISARKPPNSEVRWQRYLIGARIASFQIELRRHAAAPFGTVWRGGSSCWLSRNLAFRHPPYQRSAMHCDVPAAGSSPARQSGWRGAYSGAFHRPDRQR